MNHQSILRSMPRPFEAYKICQTSLHITGSADAIKIMCHASITVLCSPKFSPKWADQVFASSNFRSICKPILTDLDKKGKILLNLRESSFSWPYLDFQKCQKDAACFGGKLRLSRFCVIICIPILFFFSNHKKIVKTEKNSGLRNYQDLQQSVHNGLLGDLYIITWSRGGHYRMGKIFQPRLA